MLFDVRSPGRPAKSDMSSPTMTRNFDAYPSPLPVSTARLSHLYADDRPPSLLAEERPPSLLSFEFAQRDAAARFDETRRLATEKVALEQSLVDLQESHEASLRDACARRAELEQRLLSAEEQRSQEAIAAGAAATQAAWHARRAHATADEAETERRRIADALQQAEADAAVLRARLDVLTHEREAALMHAAAFEARVGELSDELAAERAARHDERESMRAAADGALGDVRAAADRAVGEAARRCLEMHGEVADAVSALAAQQQRAAVAVERSRRRAAIARCFVRWLRVALAAAPRAEARSSDANAKTAHWSTAPLGGLPGPMWEE
jgi:hypothetical protein